MRFPPFRNNCVFILRSTSLQNVLTSRLDSLLSLSRDILFPDESSRESKSFQCSALITTTKINEGAQNISADTGSDEDHFTHDPTETGTRPQEDYISPDITLGVSDVWNDFDFDQMLDQQFLDPSWLEDIQV
jgi:hypothetical protein